jgi:hypothetical protein
MERLPSEAKGYWSGLGIHRLAKIKYRHVRCAVLSAMNSPRLVSWPGSKQRGGGGLLPAFIVMGPPSCASIHTFVSLCIMDEYGPAPLPHDPCNTRTKSYSDAMAHQPEFVDNNTST